MQTSVHIRIQWISWFVIEYTIQILHTECGYRHTVYDIINFSRIKKIRYLTYIFSRCRWHCHFVSFKASHINMFCFFLKLLNKIFLRSSSSSYLSFNVLANEKINQNSTLHLQLIEISPHSQSTASHAKNGLMG